MDKLKAYEIYDKYGYNEYSLIVFAENRGKAISYALGTDEFPSCDWDFTQLRAYRRPNFDKYYHGSKTMDWDDDNDRYAMVSEGFYCGEDAFDPDYCNDCCAKDICSRYEEYVEEEESECSTD